MTAWQETAHAHHVHPPTALFSQKQHLGEEQAYPQHLYRDTGYCWSFSPFPVLPLEQMCNY